MKSAYELALERLDQQGIERPREEGLSDTARAEIAELRSKADAKLAELQILHRDRLAQARDATSHRQEEDEYRRERRRIEEDRDRKIVQARGA